MILNTTLLFIIKTTPFLRKLHVSNIQVHHQASKCKNIEKDSKLYVFHVRALNRVTYLYNEPNTTVHL